MCRIFNLQAYLEDIAGSAEDHRNEVNVAIRRIEFSGLPMHMKVISILYCSLLSVQ